MSGGCGIISSPPTQFMVNNVQGFSDVTPDPGWRVSQMLCEVCVEASCYPVSPSPSPLPPPPQPSPPPSVYGIQDKSGEGPARWERQYLLKSETFIIAPQQMLQKFHRDKIVETRI